MEARIHIIRDKHPRSPYVICANLRLKMIATGSNAPQTVKVFIEIEIEIEIEIAIEIEIGNPGAGAIGNAKYPKGGLKG